MSEHLRVPRTISEAEADVLGMPVSLYERAVGFGSSRVAPHVGGEDKDCICRGNWRLIVKECEGLIGKWYRDGLGDEYRFYGIVHGDDDYYYGMAREGKCLLLSCVGSMEGHGFHLMTEEKP